MSSPGSYSDAGFGDVEGGSAQELFVIAEHERKHGSSQIAAALYRQARNRSERSSDIWFRASHMGAVCHRVMGEFETSLIMLSLLLRDPRTANDVQLQAHLLRDKADALRKLGRYEEANQAAIESFELYIAEGDLAQIGASRGFLARIAWDEGDEDAARAMATEAAEELNESDNREVELYHIVFFARVEAHFDPISAGDIVDRGLLLCAQGAGKEVHRRRLEIIRNNIHDLKAMDSELCRLDSTSIK